MNLVEILKNVPKGTKLYSPIFGEIEFFAIDEFSSYPITVEARDNYGNKYSKAFTKEGFYLVNYSENEQLLFPSKENRDWNTFVIDLKPLTPCICFDRIEQGINYNPVLRYYSEKGKVFINGFSYGREVSINYIIPRDKYIFETGVFDPKDNYGKLSDKEW